MATLEKKQMVLTTYMAVLAMENGMKMATASLSLLKVTAPQFINMMDFGVIGRNVALVVALEILPDIGFVLILRTVYRFQKLKFAMFMSMLVLNGLNGLCVVCHAAKEYGLAFGYVLTKTLRVVTLKKLKNVSNSNAFQVCFSLFNTLNCKL
ncbi:hypothetical protein HELRODRAFT_169157 [Helobdella robusta]|uniref:Uncharacterized protein n=1 Tax=Helobdella robusta TaxID=6412 RepID=T1F1H9_HELRO|nr:hypothetical protein HELRODRAFT_169157 [Helobdella robusta]ESO08346.1 hypothetical protein HELRODRAFT_169157 [Helobdella robusta]